MPEQVVASDQHIPLHTYVEDNLINRQLVSICSCSEFHVIRVLGRDE